MTEKSRERDLALNLETDPKRKLTIQVAFLDNILDRNNTDVKYLHGSYLPCRFLMLYSVRGSILLINFWHW